MIGSSMYLTSSRPDIMFVVCACARFQVTPKVSHFHAVKRIFRYLKGQPKLGLWYPKDSPFDLEAYTDSDYAGASLDRKSTIGGCQFLRSRLISWQCKKKTIVANSTIIDDWNGLEMLRMKLGLKLFHHRIQQLSFIEALKFVDLHNMVAYLEKSTENANFDEIVDFLNANPIRYALTMWGEGSGQPTEPQHTPTTASPFHVEPILTIASSSQPKKTQKHRKTKRKATEIYQSSGPTTLVADETVYEEKGDSVERAATTAASLDAEQDNVNTLGSGEDRIKLQELIELCTKLSERVLALENIKTAQDLEITNLKKRVKKLEKKKKSRTPQLKRRLFKVRIESSADKSLGAYEDASNQRKNTAEYDQDEGISWFQGNAETQGRHGHDIGISTAGVTTASIPVTTATTASPKRPVNDSITDDITLAETLMMIKSSTSTPQNDKGVVVKGLSEPTATSRPQPQIPAKDKGKVIMQEPEKLVKVKGKDQIAYDAKVAQKLQEQLHAELEVKDRLAREKVEKEPEKPIDEEVRLEIEREEEASNAALIEEWDAIEARIDADAQLAERLQAEEREQMSVEERARLRMEFIAARNKLFAAKRAKEQRKKPPTKVEQRKKFLQTVKERFETTSPEGYDRLLWGDLITLFEPSEEDEIWKAQQDYTLISWRLFDSYGVQLLLMDTGIAIHMLIEKKYLHTQEMISRMLSRRLEVDHECEMAYELLRFTRAQLKK
ncbi:hypothetical protein Tco_0848914 [Tanacetum coccineum]